VDSSAASVSYVPRAFAFRTNPMWFLAASRDSAPAAAGAALVSQVVLVRFRPSDLSCRPGRLSGLAPSSETVTDVPQSLRHERHHLARETSRLYAYPDPIAS
jgi:hypothetical protein